MASEPTKVARPATPNLDLLELLTNEVYLPTAHQKLASEGQVATSRDELSKALMIGAQSRDGWATSWVDEIIRDGAGKLSLGACREFDDFRGRFGKVFG